MAGRFWNIKHFPAMRMVRGNLPWIVNLAMAQEAVMEERESWAFGVK